MPIRIELSNLIDHVSLVFVRQTIGGRQGNSSAVYGFADAKIDAGHLNVLSIGVARLLMERQKKPAALNILLTQE
jgi:hypothetical protein